MTRLELQRLAKDRIRDAKVLFAAGRYSAAYYLAGYAVECALKACIAKMMTAEVFPDRNFAEKCWTHDVERLVVLAGLKDQRDTDTNTDDRLARNWTAVKDWNETSRYARKNKREARLLLLAITAGKHGVFPWIRSRW